MRLVAQKQLSTQDALMLQEIVRILHRRQKQYIHALVQGVYIKVEDGTWTSGVTKVTALREGPEAPVELLDYGRVLYHEATIRDRWLLAYEANIKRWLLSQKRGDYVAADKSFSVLRQWQVSFYDPTRKLTPRVPPEPYDGDGSPVP